MCVIWWRAERAAIWHLQSATTGLHFVWTYGASLRLSLSLYLVRTFTLSPAADHLSTTRSRPLPTKPRSLYAWLVFPDRGLSQTISQRSCNHPAILTHFPTFRLPTLILSRSPLASRLGLCVCLYPNVCVGFGREHVSMSTCLTADSSLVDSHSFSLPFYLIVTKLNTIQYISVFKGKKKALHWRAGYLDYHLKISGRPFSSNVVPVLRKCTRSESFWLVICFTR